MRRWRTGVVCLLMAAGLATGAAAENWRRLTGIGSLRLVVEAPRSTVSKQKIKNTVELQLKSLGLPISSDAKSYLHVNVNVVVGRDSSNVVYKFDTAMLELVTVDRSGHSFVGEVWHSGTVGFA